MPEIGLGMNYCEALEKLIVHSNSVLAHLRMIGSVMSCVCEKKVEILCGGRLYL